MSDWAVISLGNRFRGDDSVGPYLLHRLRSQIEPAVPCIENGGDMVNLLEAWKDRRICLVDAVANDDLAAGAILRLDGLSETVLPSLCTTSSHGINLGEALEMGRLMHALPQRLDIYGICGENFAISAGLSPAVLAAAEIVEQEILDLLDTHTGGRTCTSNP
ncbi:hydrogenase maturation protease [Microbulbifer bruguierae]|uniref:Hydrogenase maturation protease n=1 Tax=Microbulbifer bruguierae TaxID=3029061 RepID=A0ABY8NHC6_9GAMM|nr:hydrogenase maturation protease [Microbulbifer bruguierae]WGL17102.1 hydrogenase maturation protease [Microbulbifer bruguierae]